MPKIAYSWTNLSQASLLVVDQANEIIEEYQAQGFRLTLRQLYYQFVSRDLIPNQTREYKRLGRIVNDGRLCGLIDWSAIEDRGRNLHALPSWDSPESILASCASQFRLDPWVRQERACEVWIEKEALVGVIEGVCNQWRVPYFACKGYMSQSEAWSAGRYRLKDRDVTIIHLGDHDPSGIDMTRDVEERLSMFAESSVEVVRVALNIDQVHQYSPPPNPAKTSDSRFESYVLEFGHESWELDALSPEVIEQLIGNEIANLVDMDIWEESMQDEEVAKESLHAVAEQWDAVQEFLE